jgi:quercetin dioxygenase-like cupin family protein
VILSRWNKDDKTEERKRSMKYKFFSAKDAEGKKVNENWGSLAWLGNPQIGNLKDMTVGRVVIKKGHSNPRHAHGNCEELLYLLKGRLEHTMGSEKIILNFGDTLTVAPGVFHNALSIGEEDADMMICYSAGTREFQLEK